MSFDTNFSEVRSAQNVAGAAFEGSNILFDWITPNEKGCDLDECYQYHKLKITHHTGGADGPLRPALNSAGQFYIPYLNPNYIHLLTQSLYLNIQGKQVDEILDPAISTTLFEQCFSSEEDRKTKDGLMLNNQIKQSQVSSVNNIILNQTVPVAAYTVIITNTSTHASYSFSNSIIVSGITYTYSGTINANFPANGTVVTTYPFIVSVSDNSGNIYYYSHPSLTTEINLTQATSVIFGPISNIMNGCMPLNLGTMGDKRIAYCIQQQGEFGKRQTNVITSRIPISLFNSKTYLPSNCRINLRYCTSAVFANEMIGCYNACPLIYTAKSIIAPVVTDYIKVEVLDFKLFMRYETLPNVTSLYKVPLIKHFNLNRQIVSTGQSQFVFNMPNNHVTYILIALIQQNKGSAPKQCGTDFSVGFTNASPEAIVTGGGPLNIINLRVLYGGTVKPSPDYILNMGATLDTDQENGRAFSDFTSLIQAREDRASSYDADTWYNSPIFVYKFGKNVTSDNNVLVTVNMGPNYSVNPSLSTLFLTALYNEDMVLDYNAQAQIDNISLIYE